MDTILSFFSDLILFTAGLIIATVWMLIIVGLLVEAYDVAKTVVKNFREPEKNEDVY